MRKHVRGLHRARFRNLTDGSAFDVKMCETAQLGKHRRRKRSLRQVEATGGLEERDADGQVGSPTGHIQQPTRALTYKDVRLCCLRAEMSAPQPDPLKAVIVSGRRAVGPVPLSNSTYLGTMHRMSRNPRPLTTACTASYRWSNREQPALRLSRAKRRMGSLSAGYA